MASQGGSSGVMRGAALCLPQCAPGEGRQVLTWYSSLTGLSRAAVIQYVTRRKKKKKKQKFFFYIFTAICTSSIWVRTANKNIRSIMLAVFLVNSRSLMWTSSFFTSLLSLSLFPVHTVDIIKLSDAFLRTSIRGSGQSSLTVMLQA